MTMIPLITLVLQGGCNEAVPKPAGGFRVEDQCLSFLYGGNSERLQGLLGRRRPRGTAFIATILYFLATKAVVLLTLGHRTCCTRLACLMKVGPP